MPIGSCGVVGKSILPVLIEQDLSAGKPALPQSEWIRYRLDGDALLKFAESAAIRDIPATAAQNNAP